MVLIGGSWKFYIFTIFIGAAALLYLFLKRTYTYWAHKGFKSAPNVNYIFGNFKRSFLLKEMFVQTLDTIYKDTKEPFIGIYTILRPILLVRDPDLARSILIKDFNYFTDRGIHCNEDYDPLSANLVALPGQKWRKLRAKLSPTFSSAKLKGMFSTILECGTSLQVYLGRMADRREIMDMREISSCYAINVIASVGFGIDVDCIADPGHEFRECGHKIFEPSLSNAIRRLINFIAPKMMSVFRIKFVRPDVERFIKSIVKQNLEYRENSNVIRKDFFQMLVQLRNNGTVKLDDQWDTVIKADENQKTLTLNEMAAQTFVFFAAGFETSASTLTFAMYEMTKNPTIQEKVHKEIDEVLERYNGQITYKAVSEMKYLENCVDETLRKYPIVPLLTRTCGRDYKIPGSDKIIEKGTEIFIPSFSLQRDAAFYPDPNKFDPDRFNDVNSIGKNQINRPYYPFGDGPRNCIGTKLGIIQAKAGMVALLHEFKYELVDKLAEDKLDPKSFFLSPPDGLKLYVSKR